jgi:hypothetical protein
MEDRRRRDSHGGDEADGPDLDGYHLRQGMMQAIAVRDEAFEPEPVIINRSAMNERQYYAVADYEEPHVDNCEYTRNNPQSPIIGQCAPNIGPLISR